MPAENTNRERLEAREAKILDAARAVFLKHSYQGAKMTLIAKKAGVAEGTLYLYYKNKNAIVAAILDRHWRDLTEGGQEIIEANEGSYEKLEAFAAYHLDKLVTEWRLIELGYVQYYTGATAIEDTMAYMQDYASLLHRVLQQGIDRGLFKSDIDIHFFSDMFFGTLEYAARSIILDRSATDTNAIIARFSSVLQTLVSPETGLETPQPNLINLTERLAEIADRLEASS